MRPLSIAAIASFWLPLVARSERTECRCLPGDACWPTVAKWNAFNASLGGTLITTVPIGSPCHDPNYDELACQEVQSSWPLPQLHLRSSSSVMQAYFANRSCDPFTPRSQPCELGNYVSYTVNASCAAHVTRALSFARQNNVRLVVRNTGHDFFGRSTGAGALAIWTHNLKHIDFLSWSDPYYDGPAVKVGSGVLGVEAIEAAHARNLVLVTGTCPTVGLAGGYTQGGGHSALSTAFGLAADQTLEFEVVTAASQIVKASRTVNSDLYWALSGGGGGTYGVVISMTIRAHPESTIGGASLQIAAASTTREKFNEAIAVFHSLLPNITDQGAMINYWFTTDLFVIRPVTAYNSTATYVKDTVLAPFTAKLTELGIPASINYTELSYRDHYDTYMGPLPYGHLTVEAYQYGTRLIPRSVVEGNNDALQAVLQNLTDHGVLAVGSVASFAGPKGADNAANSAWRKAAIHMQLATPWNSSADAWDTMLAAQTQMTDEFVPQLTAVTPESGVYFNEGDFHQPGWQQAFFGSNYATLLAIKNKWDPESMFYVLKGVGSEAWTVREDGRVCRT